MKTRAARREDEGRGGMRTQRIIENENPPSGGGGNNAYIKQKYYGRLV
jgi:hypothetical protein